LGGVGFREREQNRPKAGSVLMLDGRSILRQTWKQC
jgi:hypothetical protein